MATRQEVKDELNNRPITGYPAGGTIGGAVLRDPKTGNAIGGYGLTYKAPDVNDPSARIGDYVLQNGKAVVVPNSVSDLKQKYAVISGGSEKPDSVSGSSAALSSLSKGVMGKVIGGTVAKAAAGSAAGGSGPAVRRPAGPGAGAAGAGRRPCRRGRDGGRSPSPARTAAGAGASRSARGAR